jgi:hypothetical protein
VLELEGRMDSTRPPISALGWNPRNRARKAGCCSICAASNTSAAQVFACSISRPGAAPRMGGRSVICGMSDTVRELFSIAGFLKPFTILPTPEEALSALT